MVCAGADTEGEHGLADTLQNVKDQPDKDANDKPNSARFAYIPIFQSVSRDKILEANENQGGWYKVYVNPAVTGPLLGFEDRHGGARVLGAAAYNLYKLLPKAEAVVVFTIMDFHVKQLPPEMQTPDGIALHGETIAGANQKVDGANKPPILADKQPADATQLVNLNTAFVHDLMRVPPFQAAPKKAFPDFDGTTIAELIVAIRAGRCGVVIREKDEAASAKEGTTVIRNKIDGYRGVKDLARYEIVDAAALAPFVQWLRV